MRRYRWGRLRRETGKRRGVATLDYVLVLGIILPMAGFILWIGPRMIRLAYDMVCVLVSWPFM
jgi:hypothetical protein